MTPSIPLDRNGLEVLGRDESLRLLATAVLGRIAVTRNAVPTILPVNFWFDGERVLVRTDAGSKLAAALAGDVLAFEVDDIDPLRHAGWSVVVTGPASEVTSPEALATVDHAPLAHWAPGGGHVLAIDPAIVSGRRLVPGARRAR